MSTMFSGPPKPPKMPVIQPPTNTALDAQLAALQRRQGSNSAMLTGPGGSKAGNPSVLGKTLTGQ